MDDRGLLSFVVEGRFYTLYLPEKGWLAVEMLHFLDDILEAPKPEIQIVKTLGFTIEISEKKPEKKVARHWVVVDLSQKFIETTSPLLAGIVDEELPKDSPLGEITAQKIYSILDNNDFTVKIYR